MRLGGILDLSTIDFPGKLCSVVFLTGCPFRCPYCHNHELVNSKGVEVSPERVASELSENYLIDGVCITGGEPTMQNDLADLLRELKERSLSVKLDTNGYYPERLEKLVELVDYVAIDFKTSPRKYGSLTSKRDAWDKVEESLKLLNESGILWEIRMTVVPSLVWEDELKEIADTIRKAGIEADRIVLQQFSNENPLDPSLKSVNPPTKQELFELAEFFNGAGGAGEGRTYVRCSEGEFRV